MAASFCNIIYNNSYEDKKDGLGVTNRNKVINHKLNESPDFQGKVLISLTFSQLQPTKKNFKSRSSFNTIMVI